MVWTAYMQTREHVHRQELEERGNRPPVDFEKNV